MEPLSELLGRAVQPCACGGVITVESESPATIRDAVMAHNDSPIHRRWRRTTEAVIRTRIWRAELRTEVQRVRLARAGIAVDYAPMGTDPYEGQIGVALARRAGAQSGAPRGERGAARRFYPSEPAGPARPQVRPRAEGLGPWGLPSVEGRDMERMRRP